MGIGRRGETQARSTRGRGPLAGLAFVLAASVGTDAIGRGGWPDPPGGWTYIYEALPGDSKFVPGEGVVGLLDGTWSQHSSSSQWDGSAPGEVDSTTVGADGKLSGASPGGARIRLVPGAGEDGGDASVLSIEDPGDPTVPDAKGRAWSDPSNRKIYFRREVSGTGDVGWTLFARFRLTPDPIDVDVSARGFRGLDVQSDGKGQLAIIEEASGAFSISLGEEGTLQIGPSKEEIPIADPTRFHSVWVALRRVLGGAAFRARVFVDGAREPAFDGIVPAGRGRETDAPARCIAMGLQRSAAAAAMEVDAFGFRDAPFDPGIATECPANFACTVEDGSGAPRAILRWANPQPYLGFDILRDGEVLARDLPGDADLFIDGEPIAGTHRYELVARAEGGACALSACEVSLCPADLRFRILYPEGRPIVTLQWSRVPGITSIDILRDGVLIAQGLGGDATSYVDEDPPPLRTITRYGVVGHGPGGAACAAVDYEDVLMLPPERPWAPPPGGWDWSYDAEGHDPLANPLDRYVPEYSVPGNLDGAWIRSADSDRWDGSSPGEWGPPPDGPAPGGVRIDRLEGAGPCGEAIAVLRIEDAGDPHGYGEIDNRKIFLGRDTAVTDRNLLASGLTFSARWRMTPDPVDLAEVRPDGSLPHKGRGQVGFFFRNTGAPHLSSQGESANLGFSLSKDNLYLSTGEKILDGLRAGEFVSLWATVCGTEAPGKYAVEIFLAGDEIPVFSGQWKLAPEAEPSFGEEVVNAIAMGLNESAGDGSIQIDRIAAKAGVFRPRAAACEGRFRRGDVDGDGRPGIGDAIFSLNYLFAGGSAPRCLDAADVDDSGGITIGDAIALLAYLFAGGPPPAAPGPEVCGADPTPDDLPPCFDPSCP